jgi:hypothetical protein
MVEAAMNWATPKGLVELYEEEEALLADLLARLDVAAGVYNADPVLNDQCFEACS